MAVQATLLVPAKLDDVDTATGQLREQAAALLGGERLDRFEIATSEALTNIVRHAYAERTGGEIAVELFETDAHSLVLVLRDNGKPAPAGTFNVKADRVCDPDDILAIPEAGWGVGLLHQCADSVRFDSTPERNELRLEFQY